MQSFNYHTHTYRCGHASGYEEEYVKAAIKAGYKVLGFSDHAPYINHFSPRERMHEDTFLDYVNTVNELKDKYKDQIMIYIGLEIEYYKEQIDELKYYRELLDYCIIGQHSDKVVIGHDYFLNCDDHWVLVYAKQIVDACNAGLVDIIAHPDLFMLSRESWSDACSEATNMICECSLKYSIPLELNMGGLRYGKKEYQDGSRYVYPYRKFWEFAEQYQVPVVYGLDAHTPDAYLKKEYYDEVNEIVQGLDLKFVDDVLFKGKKREIYD